MTGIFCSYGAAWPNSEFLIIIVYNFQFFYLLQNNLWWFSIPKARAKKQNLAKVCDYLCNAVFSRVYQAHHR